MQGYVNLKGYGEFDAHERASGWNALLTRDYGRREPRAVRGDFLVELRGFEPLTSSVPGQTRL